MKSVNHQSNETLASLVLDPLDEFVRIIVGGTDVQGEHLSNALVAGDGATPQKTAATSVDIVEKFRLFHSFKISNTDSISWNSVGARTCRGQQI